MAKAYASVVPRITRDVAAIDVDIDPHGAQPPGPKVMGRGTPEEGGGLLRGGLELKNRFTATINDPEVPFGIVLTVAAVNGWLAAESVTVSRRADGPPVNAESLRALALSLYMGRVREALQHHVGGGLLMKEATRTEEAVSHELPLVPADWDGFAEMRRAVRQARITPEIAAAAYREALESLDPDQSRRPTAAAAEKLGVSRGYISGLLSQARQQGIEGLGPGRPASRRASP
jgi:hypothetical protein